MTQLDILSKNIMGAGTRGVNFVGVAGAKPEEMKFALIGPILTPSASTIL